eukprot:1965674-Pyramimonas_sp.AAC.1
MASATDMSVQKGPRARVTDLTLLSRGQTELKLPVLRPLAARNNTDYVGSFMCSQLGPTSLDGSEERALLKPGHLKVVGHLAPKPALDDGLKDSFDRTGTQRLNRENAHAGMLPLETVHLDT